MSLLQITGDAVVTEVAGIEGRCNIAVHLEIYNPSPSETVQIVDHQKYYLSSSGSVEHGRWGSPDFYGMGPSVGPGERRIFDTTAPWPVGQVSHLLLDVQVTSGPRSENVIAQIPVVLAATRGSPRCAIAGDGRLQVVPPPVIQTVVVPDCVDRTEAQARQLIVAAGLRVGSIVFRAALPGVPPVRPDPRFAVVDQRPRPGTMTTSGSTVALTMVRES